MQKPTRFQIPQGWPHWNKRCGAQRRQGGGAPCRLYAVAGMPTCRFHGSGGRRNAELGQLRYLCWVITGGPQNMRVADACRVTLAAFFHEVLQNGKVDPMKQLKAALWLTQLMDEL